MYDEESGPYYLGSRYYDPVTGRFVNADGFVSTGTGLMGYNMFAYCNNNPVMYVDPSGTRSRSAILEDIMSTKATINSLNTLYDDMLNNIMTLRHPTYNAADCLKVCIQIADAKEQLATLQSELEATPVPSGKDYSVAAIIGGGIAMADSPAPGPADVIGGIAALVITGYIFFSKGKSNPGDLEKGMTNYQKGMFQREIEDWKSSQGMPPNHNLPWDVLVSLAEFVKETYKK